VGAEKCNQSLQKKWAFWFDSRSISYYVHLFFRPRTLLLLRYQAASESIRRSVSTLDVNGRLVSHDGPAEWHEYLSCARRREVLQERSCCHRAQRKRVCRARQHALVCVKKCTLPHRWSHKPQPLSWPKNRRTLPS